VLASDVSGRLEVVVNGAKRILRPFNAVLLVLFAGCFLTASPQSQPSDSLIVKAKGHGSMTSAVDKREITSALIVLRQNGTVLVTVAADLQLQAEGTWKASTASSEEILLKITGGALRGEVTGSGTLVLTGDRKSIKELTLDLKSSDGQEIAVTFAGGDSELVGHGLGTLGASLQVMSNLREVQNPGELCKRIPQRCRERSQAIRLAEY